MVGLCQTIGLLNARSLLQPKSLNGTIMSRTVCHRNITGARIGSTDFRERYNRAPCHTPNFNVTFKNISAVALSQLWRVYIFLGA